MPEPILPIRPDTAPLDPLATLRDRPDAGRVADQAEVLRPLLVELVRLVRAGQGQEGMQLISAKEFARLLGVSSATFERLKSAGKLPGPIVLTAGCHRWRAEEIRLWVEASCPDRRTWEARQASSRRARP